MVSAESAYLSITIHTGEEFDLADPIDGPSGVDYHV